MPNIEPVCRKRHLVEHERLRVGAFHFRHSGRRIRLRSAARNDKRDIPQRYPARTQTWNAGYGRRYAAVGDTVKILYQHVPEIRLPARRGIAPSSKPHEYRRLVSVHFDVAHHDIVHSSAVHHFKRKRRNAANAIRDAGNRLPPVETVVALRTDERAVLYSDIAKVGIAASAELDRIAATRKTAVADSHIRHGKRLVALGLERNRVIVRIDVAVLDRHVRGLDVYAVVRIVHVVEALYPAHSDSIAVPEMAPPRRAATICEILKSKIAAPRKSHQHRKRLRLALAF